MRWKRKEKAELWGQRRVVSRFLLLPTTLKGETRWLERAYICQTFDGPRGLGAWVDVRWSDLHNA